MELKEIQALVSSCLEIDPNKRHVLVVDCLCLSQSVIAELMDGWERFTGNRPVVIASVGGEGLRIFEIKKEDNHEG